MSYKPSNPNGQATMANSAPVVIASNQSAIPVTGTFWQATQPVSLASVPSHPVTNAGTFPVQVSSALPTGANAIGSITNTTFAATQSGTWTVGLSAAQTLATVTNLAQLGGTAISMNTGVRDAGTQRVTIATNDSVPVTGTFWQATQPVSLASVPSHPVTNAGTFAVQATQSGTWNIGTVTAITSVNAVIPGVAATNLGKATNAASGATDTGVAILGVREDALVTLPSADGDYTRLKLNSVGRVWVSAAIDAALPTGTNSIGNIGTITNQTQMNGQAISMGTGVRDAGTQRVTIATNDSVPVTGTFWQTTQPVSGTVTANAGTGNFTVTQATASNLNATVTGTVELGATSLAALENINVTIPGTVELGTISLTALESITVVQPTAANFLNKPYGSVTTAAPTYINSTDNALSLTTSGSLRVDVMSALPAGTNNIGDVDVLSVIPGTAATNLGKATNAAAGATDTGVAILGVREDSLVTLPSADGDYTRLKLNSLGRVWVSAAIDTALPTGTNSIGNIGTITNQTQMNGQAISMGTGVRDAGTQRVTIATNDSVPVTGTFWQATQPVSIASVPSHPVTNAGTFPVQVSSALPAGTNNIGDVDVLSIIPGTAATNLGKAVDSASGATDTGVAMLAIRDDALTTVIPVDGDYSRLRLTSVGRLWTSATIDAALPTGANVIGGVTQSGTWNIATVTTLSQFAGQAINLGAGTTSTGTLRTIDSGAATGTQATPSLSTTSATLLAANTNRRGASVFNNSTSIVYVRLSATASSTTTFTVKLEPNDYYEVPSNYNGAITAILNTGTSTAVQVTEIT